MGCVNKASKEFKDLAAKHNLDSNALELITHKYWLQTGNETLFPTDIYIQAQLGNTSYKENNKAVRKLWDLKYSTPLEYSTRESLLDAKNIALQYFPEEAVVSYRNAKGNFILSIKRPVEHADYTKDSFFEEMDNVGSMKNIKTIDLDIRENQTYGIGKVQQLYNKFNTDRTSQALADRVFNIAKDLGLNITFNESLPFGTIGRYTNNNTIVYKKSFLERDIMNNMKAPIILHEVLHALSMYALSDQTANWKRPEALQEFRTEMNSLYQDLKSNPILKGERGIVDVKEFVAELANPVFRAKLREIDKQNKKKQSFWQRILNAFKSLLGLHVTSSYYQRSMNALDKALNAFDLDTYMKYNGVKNIFRELHDELGDNIKSMSDEELKAKASDYFDKKVYDEELQSIKKKAIADGTFMKAPNGRATNLTERQWLQVRTKAFKEWFGDWERVARIKNATVIWGHPGTGKTWLFKQGRKDIIDFDSEYKSKLGNLKEREQLKKKIGKEAYNKELDKLFDEAKKEVFKTGKKLLVSDMHFLRDRSNDLEVITNISDKEFIQRSHQRGEHDEADKMEWKNSINKALANISSDKIINTTGYISDLIDGSDASKVVDENGEPLVVFRADVSDQTIFESNTVPYNVTGIYIAGNKAMADNYARPSFNNDFTQGTVYSVFVNVKKPFKAGRADIDKWNNGELDTYDGWVYGNFPKGNGELVVRDSNQIKSATDNVGTFYTDHDDIYNYEIDNSNVNDLLSDNEKKDILRAIRTINEAKRSLIDTGGDFLYIVDHTDKDGLKHLKNGQEGFLVKEAIDIRGLSKEEINDIKSIGNEEGAIRTLQDFNRRLEGIGYKSSIYNSDSIDAKDKATNNDNAGLGKQTLEGKTRRGQSTQNSQDDFQGGQIKTGYDGTNHPRYMDVDTARDFINSISAKDLRDELNLVNQESADYDLVNGVEEKPKHSGKAVPQDFTFNDGTTVKAPFRPNAQQVDALNAMSDFIKSDETSMTLSGYAGTGKTSLMEMVAKKCRANYRNVVFCASTNKAAAVLNDKVKKAGFEAKTLNKIFGIQVEIDPNSKEYDVRNTRNTINEDALLKQGVYPGTTVIIDEASMINEENYNTINRMAKDFGLKIIYVGDSAQLAPVKEKDISKVFRNGDGKVITLTQVERTDDNAILKEATDLRNGKPLSGESSFNAKGEGVAYVSPQNRESINNIIAHYVKNLKNNPNFFRVLAYTNAAVAKYNQQVRHLLSYDTQIPQKGEPMTGYNNWGYVWTPKGGYYRFINSEAYKVVKNDKPKVVYKRLGDGRVVAMEAIPVTLEDSLGKVDTFNFMDVKTNPQNRQAATFLANEKKALWAKWRTTPGKKAKTAILKEINDIDDFLFINDNIEYKDNNGKSHLLQSKVIDFGYAMTVHKSQGSTFTNVLIDDVDIQKGALQQNNNDNAANAWEAVDIGNNEERDGSNAEIIDSEAVDLFGGSSTETTASTPTTTAPKQDNNLVQQLEYVGVSRATDTVTIISNNVKKEGSPLHPENAIKESNPRSNNNQNNNNETEEYKTTDEFRRVQEASRKMLEKGLSKYNTGVQKLDDEHRSRIGGLLKRLLDSQRNGAGIPVRINVTHKNKDGRIGSFNIKEVNGKLFHDIFEVTRTYLGNGELVDLHDNYDNAKCFVTDDGLCGFAIEPDGNLVSVFSLSPTTNKGFLYAIKDFVRQEGATHLDAYASPNQPLQKIYAKTLGFHTASTMDYNMEYDHDDIAKNHGNPQVVFMVDHEVAEPKHFDKDSYDAAQQYQLDQLNKSDTTNTETEEGSTQMVELPGYELSKGLPNAVPVDAEWKISYLTCIIHRGLYLILFSQHVTPLEEETAFR